MEHEDNSAKIKAAEFTLGTLGTLGLVGQGVILYKAIASGSKELEYISVVTGVAAVIADTCFDIAQELLPKPPKKTG